MMCDRCDEPLAPGEVETRIIAGASGSGGTVRIHKGGCRTEPTNRPVSYQVTRRR